MKQIYTVSTHDDVLCNLFISIIFLNEEMNDGASDENRSTLRSSDDGERE